jgi:hypothetical protein
VFIVHRRDKKVVRFFVRFSCASALNHYSFLLFLSKHETETKNKLKDIQSKIQENIINASVTGQEIERKKIFYMTI